MTGAKVAERLMVRPEGATMEEIVAASGGFQYNVLTKLQSRGYTIRKVKEGRATRYFAEPPAEPSFTATVSSKGQVTLPKEIRDRLGVATGGRLRMVVRPDDSVVVKPLELSVRRLKGALGQPPRKLTLDEMDEAVRRAGKLPEFVPVS